MRLRDLCMTAAAATAALAAGVTAVAAQDVTIRYSSWLPTTHWYVASSIVPLLEQIETVTEGRVHVDILPKMVGTPQSQFEVVRDGLADMSWIVAGYTPGRFKLAEMGELPFNGDSAAIGPVFHRTYMKHLAQYDEFDGVEILAIYTGSPGHVATRNRKIETIDDFVGLKLRSASDIATKELNTLGAVPILKSATEAYELLSTGAIDGSLMIPETVVSTNSIDLLNTYTRIPGGFFNTVHAIIINPDKWAEISPQDQDAIRSIAGEKVARTVGEAYAAQNTAAFEAMTEAGYDVSEVSPELLAQIKQKLAPIEAEWIAAARTKGVEDPEAILAAFRAEYAASEASAGD